MKNTNLLYPFFNDVDGLIENFFTELSNQGAKIQGNYPPTNIYSEVQGEDTVNVIEIAVSGFKKEEIEITLNKNILTIKGHKEPEQKKDGRVYTMKNLSSRSFERSIVINDKFEKIESRIEDGVLIITIYKEKEIEEIKKIDIN